MVGITLWRLPPCRMALVRRQCSRRLVEFPYPRRRLPECRSKASRRNDLIRGRLAPRNYSFT
jgi:hypothetical protein